MKTSDAHREVVKLRQEISGLKEKVAAVDREMVRRFDELTGKLLPRIGALEDVAELENPSADEPLSPVDYLRIWQELHALSDKREHSRQANEGVGTLICSKCGSNFHWPFAAYCSAECFQEDE